MDVLYFHTSQTPSRAHAFGTTALPDCSPPSASCTAALGLSQDSPLCIRTPLQMPAGSWLWVTAPSALHVVSASTVIKSVTQLTCTNAVYLRPHHDTWLIPSLPLDSSFATGWNKLPTELKVQILSYNLSFPETIDRCDTNILQVLDHHLRISPEIAGLAKEIFYCQNTFRIRLKPMLSHHGLPLFPIAHKSIRKIVVEVNMVSFTDWKTLSWVSKGNAGLSNVRHVSVVVNCRGAVFSPLIDDIIAWLLGRIHDSCDESIVFKCKGELTFTGRLWQSGNIPSITDGIQKVEALMRSKVAFEDDSKDEV